MTRVEFVIEELVLVGFDAGVDTRSVGDAVQAELARLLGVRGEPGIAALSSGLDLDALRAGAFDVASGADAPAIGGGIAGSLYYSVLHAAQHAAGAASPRGENQAAARGTNG